MVSDPIWRERLVDHKLLKPAVLKNQKGREASRKKWKDDPALKGAFDAENVFWSPGQPEEPMHIGVGAA